jgi:hypothetical protein
MRRFATVACLAACACAAAHAAQWAPVRSSDTVSLMVDRASVARKGDQVTLKYLVDYARPQRDVQRQLVYRSTVVKATVRCKARTLSLGDTELYTGPRAAGVMVATAVPSARERAFAPIEKGTSDEDVWRHVCESPAKKPPA